MEDTITAHKRTSNPKRIVTRTIILDPFPPARFTMLEDHDRWLRFSYPIGALPPLLLTFGW